MGSFLGEIPLKELPMGEGHLSVRDLPDFHIRWLEFRPEALRILEKKSLDGREQEILLWLIRMADRVGASDLKA